MFLKKIHGRSPPPQKPRRCVREELRPTLTLCLILRGAGWDAVVPDHVSKLVQRRDLGLRVTPLESRRDVLAQRDHRPIASSPRHAQGRERAHNDDFTLDLPAVSGRYTLANALSIGRWRRRSNRTNGSDLLTIVERGSAR